MIRYIVWAFVATVSLAALTQAITCSDIDSWQCADGSCIIAHEECNGTPDCPDNSDETHAVCPLVQTRLVATNSARSGLMRPTPARAPAAQRPRCGAPCTYCQCCLNCHESQFRCQYGACVDRAALCDGIIDCADGSDEIPRMCRNETQILNDEFLCKSGQSISADELCDGARNCLDGSDETLEACAGWYCAPNHFQCAYGACVGADAKCDLGIGHWNNHWDCADASDEDAVLCNRTRANPCIVPDNPEHGVYIITDPDFAALPAAPGDTFPSFELQVQCEMPYKPDNLFSPGCTEGSWDFPPPQCIRYCELPVHPSITYFCGDRICDTSVPSGTIAKPQCNDYYTYSGELRNMTCTSDWDYLPTCHPELKRDTEGSNITLYIGKDLVIHLSGSQYSVSLDYNSKTYLEEIANNEQTSVTGVPNGQEYTGTVLPNGEGPVGTVVSNGEGATGTVVPDGDGIAGTVIPNGRGVKGIVDTKIQGATGTLVPNGQGVADTVVPNGQGVEGAVVPNGQGATGTVVPNPPAAEPRRLNPAFHQQYDPIAWRKEHNRNN